MRAVALVLLLLGPAVTDAEPARGAVVRPNCDARRQACVSECRAQHFAVDPKRAACTQSCETEAARCVREQGGS